ncbi:AAA family ATPase, partial [Legionella rubrilucens]|uniref:AAA family ATPase n=1 Tax=Legionella rubrilucens TaxID=458 RepID=UPI0010545C1B
VYSVRVNHSDRLLFTTVTVNGKSCLLLLDVVLNHDYHKSRFLKPQVLRQFLEQNVPEALSKGELTFVKADSLPALWANPQSKEEEEPIEYQKATFYNQTFITLSDIQEKAVKTPLPAVISGAAGSGKSCVALAILEQAVNQYTEVPEKPLLYVTQSAKLAETMHSMWLQLPAAQTEAGKKVQFLTYQQFLAQEASELKHKKAQHKTDCMTWLDNHIASYLNAAKAAKQTLSNDFKDFLKNTESMYQAFRYLSGYLPDNPGGISARHEQFKNDNERQWLINAYTSYKKTLDDEKNTAFHPEFHTLKQSDLFDLVVVDEAQDLSGLELKNLRRAARNGHIAYCMDSNQSLKDTLSQRQFLLSSGVSHVELPVTYRCPGHVVDLANAILDIKQRLTGGLADKLEYARIIPSEQQKANPGLVQWVEPNELAKNHRLKQLAQTTQFAVVTLPQWKEKAKELFNTPLVFTPEEIKGLEYPHIAAYRLFDHDTCNDASKKINHTAVKSQQHRAKAEQGDASFAPHFNQLFTAFTRATQSLAIVEDSSVHQRKNLLTPLKQTTLKLTQNPNNNNNNNPEPKPIPASQQDWINEANKLKHLGKSEQAKAIEQQFTQPNRRVAPSPVVNNPTPARVPAINLDKGKAKPKDNKKSNPFQGLVEAVVKATEEGTPLKHPDRNKLSATFAKMKQIWLGIPVRHYPNLFIYALNHHKTIDQTLTPVSFNPVCEKLFTVDWLSSLYRENESDEGRSFLHYLCEEPKIAPFLALTLFEIPPHLWTKKITQGLDVSSPLLHLMSNCASLLPRIADRIPLEKWFEEYPREKDCLSLWVQLCFIWLIAEKTPINAHINAALKKISTITLTKPPFSPEQLIRKNTAVLNHVEVTMTLLQALALSPYGCHLIQQYLNKYPEAWTKIPVDAWLEIQSKARVIPAMEGLMHNSSGLMDQLIDRYPDLPFATPPSILSQNNSRLLAYCIDELPFFTWLLTKNPDLIDAIAPTAWFKSGFAKSTPLYWFSTTPQGRQLLILILEKNPKLIDQIPAHTWLTRVAGTPQNGVGNKSIVCWLLQDKASYRLLDLLADKLIDPLSMDEWYAHLAPVIAEITTFLQDIACQSGSAPGLDFFMRLFDTWGRDFSSEDPRFQQVNELLICLKSRSPMFASAGSLLLFTPAKTPSSVPGNEEQTGSMEFQH